MYVVTISCIMRHHAHEVEQNQCIINILVRVLYLDFLLSVRLLVYMGLENTDGYTFRRGKVNIIYKYIYHSQGKACTHRILPRDPKSSKFTTWYKTINSWGFFLVGGWGVGKAGRRILQQLVGLHYQNNK